MQPHPSIGSDRPAVTYSSLAACRAAAAALVVLFHLGGTFAQDKYFGFKALDGPFAWGDAGVEFFFVLSGFLIFTVHRQDIGRPQALPGYLLKRALRVYPAYWLVCAAVCAAAALVPSLRQSVPADALVLAKALALLPQDPGVVGGTGSPILFVAWSMQYEMLFYAVFACFVASRAAGALAAGVLLAVAAGCRLAGGCGFPLSFLDGPLLLLFVLGAAGARVAGGHWRLPRPRLVAAAASAAFVAFGAFEAVHGRDALTIDRRLVYGALAALLIVALVQAEDAGRLSWRKRWVALLGDASYALYLLHIPLISLLVKLAVRAGVTGGTALVAAFCAVFLACVAAAVAFHLTVERPLLAWLRARWRPRAAAARLPAAGHHDVRWL